MKEVVYRRYKRLKEEQQPFPQLVIIDGGKGQLGAALEAIRELDLTGKLTLVGLAKMKKKYSLQAINNLSNYHGTVTV